MMEEGACVHELGVGGEQDERLLKTSDLNPDDHQISDFDTISELIHTQDGVNMIKLRMELRLKNSARQAKNMTLSCEVKSLRQALNCSSSQVDELVDIHRDCAEMDATIRSQGNLIKKMKQENQALKAQIESNNWEKSMIIEDLIFCGEEYLITIQELRADNKDLEVRLEKAMMCGGPHMDQPMSKAQNLGQLPQLYVEVSDVDEAEERKHPSLDVQTKSWWRRQADKLVKGMGTFRRHFKCCFGLLASAGNVVKGMGTFRLRGNLGVTLDDELSRHTLLQSLGHIDLASTTSGKSEDTCLNTPPSCSSKPLSSQNWTSATHY